MSSVSIQNILTDILTNSILPVGFFEEESTDIKNKMYKQYRLQKRIAEKVAKRMISLDLWIHQTHRYP